MGGEAEAPWSVGSVWSWSSSCRYMVISGVPPAVAWSSPWGNVEVLGEMFGPGCGPFVCPMSGHLLVGVLAGNAGPAIGVVGCLVL